MSTQTSRTPQDVFDDHLDLAQTIHYTLSVRNPKALVGTSTSEH